MKKYLTIFFSILFVLISFSISYAQPGRGRDINTRVNQLKEQLNLNDKQVEKIKKIFLARQKKMSEMRNEMADGDRVAMFEKMMKQRKIKDKQIMDVLNKEQKIKYKKILEERIQRFQNRRGGF